MPKRYVKIITYQYDIPLEQQINQAFEEILSKNGKIIQALYLPSNGHVVEAVVEYEIKD